MSYISDIIYELMGYLVKDTDAPFRIEDEEGNLYYSKFDWDYWDDENKTNTTLVMKLRRI